MPKPTSEQQDEELLLRTKHERDERMRPWEEKMERMVREGKLYYDPTNDRYTEVIPPAIIPKGETLNHLVRRWEAYRKIFLESERWAALRDVLTQYLATHAIPKITSVVCVALGSLSGPGGSWIFWISGHECASARRISFGLRASWALETAGGYHNGEGQLSRPSPK